MNQSGKNRESGTRDKLIDTAAAMFADRGYDGVSIREITRVAGANLGAVTYHFGGKEGLFSEVVTRKTEKGRAIWTSITRGSDSPEVKIRKMLKAYAFYVLYDEPSLKAMFCEMIAGGRRLPDVAIKSVEWRNRTFEQVVREGIRKKVFRSCDAKMLAWIFFGMLASHILYQPLALRSKELRPYSRAYLERFVDMALDVFLNGLLTAHSGAKAGMKGTKQGACGCAGLR